MAIKESIHPFEALTSLQGVADIVYFKEIDSTNTYAKKSKITPVTGVVVIVAKSQSAGRGQRSNTFYSSAVGGLWVSFVIRLDSIENHFVVNRALSLSIASVLKSHMPLAQVSIKWPNDIYCGSKKICGILLESVSIDPPVIVAGFGCNVNNGGSSFPKDLQTIVTSMVDETSVEFDVPTLLSEILQDFIRIRDDDQVQVHSRYKSLLYGMSREIEINDLQGVFDGVEADGRLRLMQGENVHLISSGSMRFTGSAA